MKLRSSAFPDGAAIPRRFTCEGEDISPPLQWIDAPAQAKSFALLCDDPDAPGGTWHHWAAYDIAADQTALAQAAAGDAHSFKQAINDFKRRGYGGPCPPHGHGLHHYHFRLLALSVPQLTVRKDATCRDVEREARKHLLTEATLVGVFGR
jgi:Raf kinase inhibitor-like YbhB/YbcL family protein